MKIRTRIMLLFGCVTVVPLILMIILCTVFSKFSTDALMKNYRAAGQHTESIVDTLYSGSFTIMESLTTASAQEIKEIAQSSPDSLENTDWLNSKNSELAERYAQLLVEKNGKWIFTGSNSLNEEALNKLLEIDDDYSADDTISLYLGGDVHSLVSVTEFTCKDGSSGRFFILTMADQLLPEYRNLALRIMIGIIIVMFVVGIFITIWIYNSIWAPLASLSKATKEIKNGNLDYKLEIKNSDDEINSLCRNFEEMRLQLKDTVDERAQNDKESKELISNISHDLKTPLTAIKGYCEGILDGVASSPEKLDKYVRTIYNKSLDMDRLINELTFYSKIDTNKIPYNFQKIHVDDYFRDCMEELELELSSKGIELGYFNYLQGDTIIVADPEQLKRVINNIISNSVKYMDKKKGIINIRIKDLDDSIQVEIEDNGRGIAQKDLSKIFERFYRTDASRNSSKGGSGIGLSIVKKIIEDHGGKIWATSKEYTGTVMHFILRKYVEDSNNE